MNMFRYTLIRADVYIIHISLSYVLWPIVRRRIPLIQPTPILTHKSETGSNSAD